MLGHFYGGRLHGEKHVVTSEVVTTVEPVTLMLTVAGGGQEKVTIGMRAVVYRRVERGYAYGGIRYDPPEPAEPYVFEDWLP